jgi:hypothetical protein
MGIGHMRGPLHKPFLVLACVMVTTCDNAIAGDDWFTGQDAPVQPESWIVNVDTSLSVTSKGSVFGAVSATFAPTGNLRKSGLRARLEGLGGVYNYIASDGRNIKSNQESGTVDLGYEWKSKDTSVSVYGGIGVQSTKLSAPDPNNSVVGTGTGIKLSAEFYTRPSPDMMISGYGSYMTLHNAYYTRLKFGWAFTDDIYLGPEVSILGDDFYQQYRIGGHVTGVRLSVFQLGIAGGFMQDVTQGPGLYGIVDARAGF